MLFDTLVYLGHVRVIESSVRLEPSDDAGTYTATVQFASSRTPVSVVASAVSRRGVRVPMHTFVDGVAAALIAENAKAMAA